MKKTIAILAVAVLGTVAVQAQSVDLFNLGSVELDITNDQGAYSQTASNISWQGNPQFGDLVAGGLLSGPYDLTAYTGPGWEFGLTMAIVGTNPNLPFTVELFDGDFNISLYNGSTPNIVDGIALLTLGSTDVGFSFANIIGFQFTWGGTGSEAGTTVTVTDFVAVPEPSTYALLSLGALALGGYAARRRLRK